ncbi:uncharacterized protein EV420DRAFT_1559363 [Desarmillaria tabescens]|uniref:Transmembrane protein n=1 Tax=Armillaria tabescens TaxID=1929756 RepID=A0AA39MZ29_ARMTA|nr:uncharacterized protein EV420DRAFT_1559363 [Desarmillaria tabescens]KAK0452191.1 hypothetical protein EV420DRAFT_1559363 [Desarmillaria tabescens]
MSDEEMSNPQSPSRVFHCLIFSLSFIIIVPILCITLALGLRPRGGLTYARNPYLTDRNRTIYLIASLISVDIQKASVVVEWDVHLDTCEFRCTDVNIFFDTNHFSSDNRDDHGPYNDDIPTNPIFTWNSSYLTDPDFRHKDPMFSTSLDFLPYDDADVPGGSIIYYPFDSYNVFIKAFAQDAVTNASVFLSISPASGRIVDLKVTTDIFSFENDAKSKIEVFLTFQRSTLVIVYCLTITLIFWLVTLMICLIMITTVVFGFRQRNEIVVVPIGTVFAFTQLRSTMPGAPEGFGDILDFAGLLPCLILLSISAVSMVGIYLFANPDDPSRRSFTWSELENALHHYIQPIWITTQEWVQRARFRIMIARRILRAPYNVEIPLTDIAHDDQA